MSFHTKFPLGTRNNLNCHEQNLKYGSLLAFVMRS